MDPNNTQGRLADGAAPGNDKLTETIQAPGVGELTGLPDKGSIPALWEDQRLRWGRGERAPVEAYLRALPPPVGDATLLDLIYGEFVLRQEHGEQPHPEDYVRRFPNHADAIRRQLHLHEGLSGNSDTTLPPRPAPVEEPQAPVPQEVAGYRIIAPLDEGGQGSVYRGLHPALGRDVVIKIGHEMLTPEAVESLMQEGRILADLDHPGLARVYDLRLHEGRPCLVMEYIRGVNLAQRVRHIQMAPAKAAALVARVARALAAAHRRGITHRDVKPNNILIDETGSPRLIDFGLARVESVWSPAPRQENGLSGTIIYMAPEQARGEHVTPAADIFALGGVLFFLLSGRAPYAGDSSYEVLLKAGSGAWDHAALNEPHVPPRLRVVVEKAMSPDPKDRFATADEMADVLEAFARPSRRWRWIAGGVAVAAVLAVIAMLWRADRPNGTTPPTEPSARTVPPVAARPFSLKVGVGHSGMRGYGDLSEGASVATGDVIRIDAIAPAGTHTTLFLFNSEGLKPLVTIASGDTDRPIGYPEDANKGKKLDPPNGNELFLLVASRSGPVDEGLLRQWLAGPWETLPPEAVMRLAPDEVKRLVKGRGLGDDVEHPDPEGAVEKRLEALREQLHKHGDYFEGLMFSHRGR